MPLTSPPSTIRAPQLVRENALPDPAGVFYGRLIVSLDARYHLLRYRRVQSSLILMIPAKRSRLSG